MRDFLNDPACLVNKNLGGHTLSRWLDVDDNCAWYEGREEAGAKSLVYVYATADQRDGGKPHIHNYRTSFEYAVTLDGKPITLHVSVGGYRVMMPQPVKAHLVSPTTRPSTIKGYTVIEYLGSGFKGVTYKVKRTSGTRTLYALKLTVAEEYEGKSYRPEVDLMSDLAVNDRYHFPQIHECGEWCLEIDGTRQPFVYFVEDFIPGKTLETYMTGPQSALTVPIMERFTIEMLSALTVMEKLDLMHDDLHAGNIMVCDSPDGLQFCLIDFGSAKKRGDTKKTRDDIRNLASHIAAMANAITSDGTARTTYEDSILGACSSLLAVMSDDDPMRRPNNASKLLQQFRTHSVAPAFRQHLTHPFDFGNAEEVMDNQLLYQLAAKSFPWKDRIESSSHLLVIGPRGCGKTTIFRSMSFRCLADAGNIDDALSQPYLGLYISCNKDFRQRFSALEPDVLKTRHDAVRHYFNLLVLREFCGAMLCCARQGRLTAADLVAFCAFVTNHSAIPCPPGGDLVATLTTAEGHIARSIEQVRMAIWHNTDCGKLTTQDFIANLSQMACGTISAFGGKVVYLLVDDYTERKVPAEAQKAINHILFVPGSVYKSKIASEVFGVPNDQTFGSFLDQERDYKEWNLGMLYCVALPSSQQKAFLREIVDTRLAMCRFAGKVADIIGDSKYLDGTLARALRKEYEARQAARQQRQTPDEAVQDDDPEIESQLEKTSSKAYYHGWETICNLCTGDVSNILELLNRMYDKAGVKQDTVLTIAPKTQHAVIQAYSRQYISRIKGIPSYGDRLFELVDAFGTMSGRLLREYPWLDRGSGRADPYQMIRIEMDEGYVRDSQHFIEVASRPSGTIAGMSQDAAMLWVLLQRYCIFIDAEESRSRRNTLAKRVILRRIFCPAFSAGLVNSECYTIGKREWEDFVAGPTACAERYVRDTIDSAKLKRGQLPGNLFHVGDDDVG